MKTFLPLLLIFTINIPLGFCKDNSVQTQQFPNYGIFQYFVPSQDFTCKSFLPGKIITIDKNIITPQGVRYNIVEDQIECQISTQYSRISSPQKISEVEINGNLYVYKKYLYKGESVKGYLQKIHTGQQNLYVKQFLKESHNPHLKLDTKNVFFVEIPGSLPRKVNSLRSEILSIYKNQASYANSFMKNNNYQWNDSKALVQLVNYLEKLTADNVASR